MLYANLELACVTAVIIARAGSAAAVKSSSRSARGRESAKAVRFGIFGIRTAQRARVSRGAEFAARAVAFLGAAVGGAAKAGKMGSRLGARGDNIDFARGEIGPSCAKATEGRQRRNWQLFFN